MKLFFNSFVIGQSHDYIIIYSYRKSCFILTYIANVNCEHSGDSGNYCIAYWVCAQNTHTPTYEHWQVA